MKFIEEVVVDEFLPTFRSLLAADLRERGLTQSEVASLLGVSQSAVSKYVHGEVEVTPEIADDERVTALVARLGEGLASGEMTQVQALAEVEILIRTLERGDLLAQLHEAAYPPLAAYDGEFAIHDPESRLRTAEQALASVRRGVRMLENTSGFAALIPAVGSNLVETVPDAQGIDDVAAIPGRILDVKGRATVPGDPEFGVSEHVAGVLLAARAGGSDARAAVNIRYTPELVEALDAEGLATVAFDAEGGTEAVRAAAAANPGVDVLYQAGGFGIEPVIYVLGPDAVTAAETVRTLAR